MLTDEFHLILPFVHSFFAAERLKTCIVNYSDNELMIMHWRKAAACFFVDLSEPIDVYSDWVDACEHANA